MTKTMKEQCLEVLRAARIRIEGEADSFICHAIVNAGFYMGASTAPAEAYLRRWIVDMLRPYSALEAWLVRNGHAAGEDVYGNEKESYLEAKERTDKLRVTRLAWIDWMIAELQK